MAHFDVEKDAAKVKFMLEKSDLTKIVAEVVAAVDLSGSTRSLYYDGDMQEAIQRVVPVALNFDDNGELPVYGFNDGDKISTLPVLTKTSYKNYVQREIIDGLDSEKKWGGTDYAPVVRLVLRDLGFLAERATGRKTGGFLGLFRSEEVEETLAKKSKTGLPAILYLFTDGENSDKNATRDLLRSCADLSVPIYFNCVGVGRESFSFLREIADDLPNVGFSQIMDFAKTANSDEIYEHLLPKELLVWLKDFIK